MTGRLRVTVTSLLLVALAHATATTVAPNHRQRLAPFIENQTVAVGYLDLSALELQALAAELRTAGCADDLVAQVQEGLSGALAPLSQAGLRELYMVVSTDYLLAQPMALVAPLADEADPAPARQLLGGMVHGFETDTMHGAVVAAEPYALEQIRRSRPVRRPGLESAVEAAADAPAWFAFAPTDDNRRVIEETMPGLPEELGGGQSTVLTRGVRWALVGATLPPEPTVRATVQSESPQAAVALKEWWEAFSAAFTQHPEVQRELPMAVQVASMLEPRVTEARVQVTLDADPLREMASALFARAAAKAQAEARLKASEANLHRIGMAIAAYRAYHDGQWPDDLEQVVEAGYVEAAAFKNPRRPDLEVGYEYRKPPEDAAPGTALVWEKFEQWPDGGVHVVFADNALMTVRDPERFQQVLQSGR